MRTPIKTVFACVIVGAFGLGVLAMLAISFWWLLIGIGIIPALIILSLITAISLLIWAFNHLIEQP